MRNIQQYEDNLASYIQNLKDTSINFVFMVHDKIKLKTTAKMLGHSHFVTLSDTEMFYIYIYKESDVKYFMTRYQDNCDPIRILNFKLAITEDENQGDHLTFGIRRYNQNHFKIDTHETVYEFLQNKHMIGHFAKVSGADACSFEFQPIINKKYETFLNIPCTSRKKCTIDESYENDTNKRIIFHLVNKMNNIDVPIQPKPKVSKKTEKEKGGAPTKTFFEYKGYHFLHDDFLKFIQIFTMKLGVYVGVSMFYDSAYKNIICFIDFEEISRIGLAIHLPKALKACFAYYHGNDAYVRDTRILKTLTAQFEMKIAKIKKYIYDENKEQTTS